MKSLSIRLTLALAVVIVALIATSQSPPMARGTMMSSQKVALVPNAAGEGSAAGVMPTTGTVGGTSLSFGDFQFSDLAVASVSAGTLAGFDTLVLLQVDTAHFTSQQKADINAFVDGGGKLIIYDSDATNGVDYSWLLYPFSTHPPCPNCGLFGGTLTIVEDNTLSSSDPASPYYINTSEIPPNTDAVGDANVVATSDPNWFGDMEATNARGQTGWTHTYAESPSGKGVLIYNGVDSDYIGSTSWSASGIDWLAKIWYLELKQQWDPTGLPGGKPIAGQILLSPLSASLDTGQTHTLTATVRDQDNNPLSGVSVNFTVTGANPTSGSDATDAAGEATFSYVGNNEGRDTIVASATIDSQSLVSNTVHADWKVAGFSFAIITDLHVGRDQYDDEEYYLTERLRKTVDWINANAENRNIKFVVVLGDVSESGAEPQLRKAEAMLTNLNVPYVPLVGNHDVEQRSDCTLWIAGRCVRHREYRTAANFETVFPDQLKEVREQVPDAENLESNCGTPSSKGPADLQNFSFTYRGVTFVGLDFVSRNAYLGAWAKPVLHTQTKECLRDAVAQPLPQAGPVIILAHHPLLDVDECTAELLPGILGPARLVACQFMAFMPKDVWTLADIMKNSQARGASFAGHIHGFRELYGYRLPVFDSNYATGDAATQVGVPVVITEAVMAGANHEDKGFIRIVHAEGNTVTYESIQGGDLPALNPYFDCRSIWFKWGRLRQPTIECTGDAYTDRAVSTSSWEWDFNGDGATDCRGNPCSYSYPQGTTGENKICSTATADGAQEQICRMCKVLGWIKLCH